MDGHIISDLPASPHAATTLHAQITSDLLARLQSGHYAAGELIPTELDLCATYGVSRITMRRALATLVQHGLLVRQRGVGTFVTGRPPVPREFNLVGFLDDTLAYDQRLVLDRAARATAATATALGLPPGAPVRHMRSVVHRDDEPYTVADAFTADRPACRIEPQDYQPGLPAAAAMSRRLGQPIARAEQDIDAVAADAATARHLGIARHTPILRARRTYFAAGDRPIQHLVVRYHPARYRFTVELVPRTADRTFAAIPGRTS